MKTNDNASELENDVDTLARGLIANKVRVALIMGDISHEDWPDIGANDWLRIHTRILQIIEGLSPTMEARSASYRKLTARAEG